VNAIPNGVEQDVANGLECVIHFATPATAHFSCIVKIAWVTTPMQKNWVVVLEHVRVILIGVDLIVITGLETVKMYVTAVTALRTYTALSAENMQPESLMDHALVFRSGQDLLTVLSTMVNVILAVQPPVVTAVQALKHMIVTLV